MDPRWLFPMLAAVFAIAAGLRFVRARRSDCAFRTWVLLALIFAAVSAWLHMVAWLAAGVPTSRVFIDISR